MILMLPGTSVVLCNLLEGESWDFNLQNKELFLVIDTFIYSSQSFFF